METDSPAQFKIAPHISAFTRTCPRFISIEYNMKMNTEGKFMKLPFEKELELLQNDDVSFSATKKYLEPLINQSLDLFVIPPEQYKELHLALLQDVQLAGGRFLRNDRDAKSQDFAGYFTWYIGEQINKHDFERKSE